MDADDLDRIGAKCCMLHDQRRGEATGGGGEEIPAMHSSSP